MTLPSVIVQLATQVSSNAPDAKPITQSWSFYTFILFAVTGTVHNVVTWLNLGQSLEAMLVWGTMGLILFACSLVATGRRSDIQVPPWVTVIADAIIKSAPA